MDDEEETLAAQPMPVKPSRTDEIIDQWFSDTIPNSPVSRDTEGFNHVRSALADLKKRLAAA